MAEAGTSGHYVRLLGRRPMADDSALTITETLEIPLVELHFQVKLH
jgi:hypothetical protein